jgi:hypothetical protein
VRRAMLAAVIAVGSASSFLCQEAAAQWWNLPDGLDNPRPRYYDYHPPGVFYRNPGPVGLSVSGFVAAPAAAVAAPVYGSPGYGYVAVPSAVAPAPVYGNAGSGYVAGPSAAARAPVYGNAGSGYVAAPHAAARAPVYGNAGSGYVAAPYAAPPAPVYGNAGYGYVAVPYAAPTAIVPVAPRPLCGVYRYWRDGVCVDRRGY